jgi:hypothetical protein
MNYRRQIRVTLLIVFLSVQTARAFRSPERSDTPHFSDSVPSSGEGSLVWLLRHIVEVFSAFPSKTDSCGGDFKEHARERIFGVRAGTVSVLMPPRSYDCKGHQEISGTPGGIGMTVQRGETMRREQNMGEIKAGQ